MDLDYYLEKFVSSLFLKGSQSKRRNIYLCADMKYYLTGDFHESHRRDIS